MDTASSAVGLLQFVLNCFSQIQLAREFESEFEIYQLKLDLIQLRLSRWGEVAKLISNTNSGAWEGRPTPSQPQPNDGPADPENPTGDPAISILIEIRATVTQAQRCAKKNKGSTVDQPLDPDASIAADLRGVHTRIKGFINRRTSQTTKAVDSMKWAFYKRDHFDRFIADVSYLTESLESLISEEDKAKLRELSSEECKGINKPNLEELKDIAQGCDPMMEDAADEALKNARGGGTYFTQSHNTGIVTGVNHGKITGTHYWGKS
ncbi:prion-inhibition and propagation domain-containing protein [Trichoderma novae-zelandiae]